MQQVLNIYICSKTTDINPLIIFSAVTLIENCPLDQDIIDTALEFYTNLKSTYNQSNSFKSFDFRLAVRSSAISEDTEDTSSAGQNETILGLTSFDDVLKSIAKCWASLYTYQSVEYRRQHVQEIIVQMSVVIQVMVPSDCAGVMFTKHPTSGDPSKIVITANYGLGESVVSGSVEPDVYVVKRGYKNNKLNVVQTKIGDKLHSLNMSTTETIDTSKMIETNILTEEKQKACCLSEDQILKLSEIGVHLEKLYGNPRDIEWAIYEVNAKCHIYLRQN